MGTTRRYLGYVVVFLLSIVLITHITLVQRIYLTRSDTGKEWKAFAVWFGLSECSYVNG